MIIEIARATLEITVPAIAGPVRTPARVKLMMPKMRPAIAKMPEMRFTNGMAAPRMARIPTTSEATPTRLNRGGTDAD